MDLDEEELKATRILNGADRINKIVKAEGNGQSECYECKNKGKWSLTWTNFLYEIPNDEHLYCYECAKRKVGKN